MTLSPTKYRYGLFVGAITILMMVAGVFFADSQKIFAQQCGVDGYVMDGNGGCYDLGGGGRPTFAEVVLTANPSTIQQGNSSVLSWGPDGSGNQYPYPGCTIDNGIGNVPASGSVTVSPGATTQYHINCVYSNMVIAGCTGPTTCTYTDLGHTSDSYATVTVTPVTVPTLAASCSVSPTSIQTGGSATWTAGVSGGTGSYTYSWTGTDGLTGSSASVSKSYSTAGSKSGTVTVTSGSQTQTASCPNALTVTSVPPPSQADLTVGGVTPTTATVGTAVSFSATASNIGQATSGTFPMIFQIRNVTTLSAGTLPALAASASEAGSASYTFTAAGAYSVRACVDYSQTCVVAGTESDYSNNCGPWTTVTVAAAVVPNLSCSVDNASPTVGQTSTYTASGASAPYTWTAPDGGSYGTGATAQRTFSAAGNYGMTVSKAGYTSAMCPVVTAGNAPPTGCTNPTGTLTAAPTRIQSGQSSTITYTASGITTSCTLTGPGVNQTYSASSCTVPGGSVSTGALTTQATYILTCDGTERARTIVNVVPKFLEF